MQNRIQTGPRVGLSQKWNPTSSSKPKTGSSQRLKTDTSAVQGFATNSKKRKHEGYDEENEDFTRPPEASSEDEAAKIVAISNPVKNGDHERNTKKKQRPKLQEASYSRQSRASDEPVFSAKNLARPSSWDDFPSSSSGRVKRDFGRREKARSQATSSQRSETLKKSSSQKNMRQPEESPFDKTSKCGQSSNGQVENKASAGFKAPSINGVTAKTSESTVPQFSVPPGVESKLATPPKFRIPISSGVLVSSQASRESSILSSCPSPAFSPRRSQTPDSGNSSVTAPSFRTFPLRTTQCPVCKTAVLKSELDKFRDDHETSRNGFQLTARQKAAFCRLHRKTDAQSGWDEAGYPTIEWTELPSRVDSLMEDIKNVFDDQSTGFWYRERLRRDLESKSQRRRKVATTYDQDQDAIHTLGEVGYYGHRGGRIVSERVVANFSSILNTLAPRDPLILGAGGVSDFVQKVIVPETICRLVCDDMGLGDDLDAGRDIMQKSQEVGRILCEEEDEVALQQDLPNAESVI